MNSYKQMGKKIIGSIYSVPGNKTWMAQTQLKIQTLDKNDELTIWIRAENRKHTSLHKAT